MNRSVALTFLAFALVMPVVGSTFDAPVAAAAAQTACSEDDNTLCLNGDRFEIRIDFTTSNGDSGEGRAEELTNDTGYFWFFDQANVEVVVKVLDGCAINGNFWVFAGGLTDVEVQMTIRDTENGTVKTFDNPQKTPFDPVQDTGAFMTC
ncbi:MAG: hypothetical protein AAGK22_28160 [Acidobacteriota bacterium]